MSLERWCPLSPAESLAVWPKEIGHSRRKSAPVLVEHMRPSEHLEYVAQRWGGGES